MIDLDKAKELVSGQLSRRAERVGTPLRIVEEEIEEHDWGWVIYWEPVPTPQQASVNPSNGGMPYLVDRVSGHVLPAGTYGLKVSITKLLQLRGK